MKNDKLVNDVNKEILNLWKQEKISNLVPLLYPELNTHSLLSIGFNPSFSEKGIKSNIKGTKYDMKTKDIRDYYSYDKNSHEIISREKIEILKGIELESKIKYKFFNKLKELANELNLPWEHIDLLYMRHTKQKEIEKLFKTEKNIIDKQIDITLSLIQKLDPEIIIIQNAFVSKILHNPLELKWNPQIGTYLYMDKIPVFLSGMLSGQRALDLGSFERLKWHMKFALKKLNLN